MIWTYGFSKIEKKMKKSRKYLTKSLLLITLIFIASSIACLSVLTPFALDIVIGGIINSQIEDIFHDSDLFYIEKGA
ncbi:hypothetical protein TNCV_4406421 [Trichonephila clavipes]|nr:hypothetical protein TNCV_4406421 [Trichonephila clavipes]